LLDVFLSSDLQKARNISTARSGSGCLAVEFHLIKQLDSCTTEIYVGPTSPFDQRRLRSRGGSYGGSMNAKEHGYQHGYRDGLRQGRADLNANTPHSFESEDYKHADLGYERYMGERDDFQKGTWRS
jgi:hypothetical protein